FLPRGCDTPTRRAGPRPGRPATAPGYAPCGKHTPFRAGAPACASPQNDGYPARVGASQSRLPGGEEGTVTRRSVVEYVAAQRERYAPASRPEKGRLLDEMVAVTGYHRKAVLRLLGGRRRAPPSGRRPGHPREYGPAVAAAAQLVWEAAGQIGTKRLQPFVPELVARLRACGGPALEPATRQPPRPAAGATCERPPAPAP